MLESYGRRKEQERKLKIQDDFIIAEVIALNILAPVAGDKEAMPHGILFRIPATGLQRAQLHS